MNKKIRQNRFKPETDKSEGARSGSSIDFCLKCIMIMASISILSLALIFSFDFLTQSSFFKIKKVEISGTNRVLKDDILKFANLAGDENIFKINLFSIEKLIASHPWIQSATVKRNFSYKLMISIIEQEPLAIVKIENLADILINTRGLPFKEYNPNEDHIGDLPVISGVDLTRSNEQYMFNGPLFNSIMEFLQTGDAGQVRMIKGNKNTGIAIEAKDIYNEPPVDSQGTVQIKLGFDNFKAKLKKAKEISQYIDKNFPEKTICSMDLFNIEKVFIKTKIDTALHHNLEKGV